MLRLLIILDVVPTAAFFGRLALCTPLLFLSNTALVGSRVNLCQTCQTALFMAI